MSRKQKKTLVRILISGALFAGAVFHSRGGNLEAGSVFNPLFCDWLGRFVEGCPQYFPWQVFDENFLMSIATIGAFCLVSILRAWRLCCFTR